MTINRIFRRKPSFKIDSVQSTQRKPYIYIALAAGSKASRRDSFDGNGRSVGYDQISENSATEIGSRGGFRGD
jgi:hypothetical protein